MRPPSPPRPASGPAWRRCWSATTRRARATSKVNKKPAKKPESPAGCITCRPPLPRPTCSPGRPSQRRPDRPRHPGPAAAAGAHRRGGRRRCGFAVQGRGRLRPREPRPSRRRPAALPGLYALRRAATPGPQPHSAGRRHVVVIGRSNIVGRPLSLILSQKGVDATVTLCHSRSRDVASLTDTADIVVAAIGSSTIPATWCARRRGRGRRHESHAGRPLGRRRRLRRAAADRLGDHARAGRRRADDHHHAAAQHRPRGDAATRSCASAYQSNAASGIMLAVRLSAVAWAGVFEAQPAVPQLPVGLEDSAHLRVPT